MAVWHEEIALDSKTVEELEKQQPNKQDRDRFVDEAVKEKLSKGSSGGR